MNLCVCLDDKGGMLFNKRRQSRDSALCQKLLEISQGKKLWMSEYSAKIFPQDAEILIDEEFLDKAEIGDFCFCEKAVPTLENAEYIYVFLWNRRYPGDVFFGFDLANSGFILESSEDFPGSSHEKITLNIYRKEITA